MARPSSTESIFQVIACPTRRALLDALADGERNASQLVASLDVSQSAVSQQLAVLKTAGLVEERAESRFRYYRLRARPLEEVQAWMSRYRQHIEHQLDALGRVLDAMPDDAAPTNAPPPPRRKKKP
jgi:DNA-binding transcriptional ArsR family regulator